MYQSKIMVVDDEPAVADSLKDLLEMYGHEIDTASSGFEALSQIKQSEYSIVLMDVRMPGINGVETFREIKKLDSSCTVIMMTAYSTDDLLAEAVEEGAHTVLFKPLNIEKLVSIIEDIEKSKLILIVDDNPSVRESLLDVLELQGLHVVTADSGQEAIDKVKESNYGVVLLDVVFPDTNGLDIYNKLKKIRSDIKVVLITAHRQIAGEIIQQAIDSCVYTCLNKPFDLNLLSKVVYSIIKGEDKSDIRNMVNENK